MADRVELTGQLPRDEALARARAGHVFVMPSVDEAFGVAYVEAMAAGLPAVGARGEAGPQEIAAAGDGLRLVPPADVEALAAELDALLAEPAYLLELGARARATVVRRLHLGAVRARDGAGLRGRAAVSARPVLFVTNHVPPDRAGAFRALHERVALELALFGGRSHHATAGLDDPGVPFRRVAQREVHGLAASGRYAAVVCGTAGRVALPAAFLGADRARTPVRALERAVGRPADARRTSPRARCCAASTGARRSSSATGPHVTAYARRLGARAVAVAPQAVDNAFWATPVATDEPRPFTALFVGRDVPEKGLAVLRRGVAAGGPRRRPPERRRGRRAWSPPRRSATPTPRPTFWSYLRSPPATSSSRGGSSPTKP